MHYTFTSIYFLGIAGTPHTIPFQIISLGIIKVLYSCAKREGLYDPLHVRKEYMPLMIRKRSKTASRRNGTHFRLTVPSPENRRSLCLRLD